MYLQTKSDAWPIIFPIKSVVSTGEAIEAKLLNEAKVFLLGAGVANPVSEIQKITAADKHLSVVVLVQPTQVKQLKQAIQFAPYVGNSTLVITLNPELDLQTVVQSAATGTYQKRSFNKIRVGNEALGPLNRKNQAGSNGPIS